MKDLLEHKGFLGSVHFSTDDEIFFGKIEGIDDLITFEGESVQHLKEGFISAVDDYMDICKNHNKSPEKSFKGSFNVRIPTELHKKAFRKSLLEGVSLNQFVVQAIEKELIKS